MIKGQQAGDHSAGSGGVLQPRRYVQMKFNLTVAKQQEHLNQLAHSVSCILCQTRLIIKNMNILKAFVNISEL